MPVPPPDYAQAAELYKAANFAMDTGRYADAARDFGGAYAITHDPVLFFKIGSADDKAGNCDAARIYYGRYLREAKPEPKFVEITQQRMAACGAPVTLTLTPTRPTPPPAVTHRHGRDTAWLMVGGSLAFVTMGVVLAYSASSSEQDVSDLYVGISNTTPTYDAATAKKYQDLIDEGHRFQYLSWASFGIATGFAAMATILFVRGERSEHHVSVTPIVAPHDTGVAATFRF